MFPSIPYLLWSPLSVEAVPRRVNRGVQFVLVLVLLVRGRPFEVEAAVLVVLPVFIPIVFILKYTTLLFRPTEEWDDLSGRGVDDLASPFSMSDAAGEDGGGLGLGEAPIGEGGSDIVLAVNRTAVVLVRMISAVKAVCLQSLPDITPHQVSAECAVVGE
jgi:hypothetical protein